MVHKGFGVADDITKKNICNNDGVKHPMKHEMTDQTSEAESVAVRLSTHGENHGQAARELTQSRVPHEIKPRLSVGRDKRILCRRK